MRPARALAFNWPDITTTVEAGTAAAGTSGSAARWASADRADPAAGPFGRGGGRARRGDVRTALITLLAEEPRNGYQLMQEIERRSEGVWRPSPGSVYPALQQLEDEGLVRAEETDGRKLFHLTDEGRTAAEASAGRARRGTPPATPSTPTSGSCSASRARSGMAVFQIAQAGTADQLASAREILTNARRALYGILAEDETTEDPPQEA